STLLPLAAMGSSRAIFAAPLMIALTTSQGQQSPQVVAHPLQPRRPPIVASKPRETPEPNPRPSKQEGPPEPATRVSKTDEKRTPEVRESARAARDSSDLPQGIDRPTPPEKPEPMETPSPILQDQDGGALDDVRTEAPAEPASPSPSSKKASPKSAEPAFQPPSWLPTRRVVATVMYRLHLSSPSLDQLSVR